MADLFNGDFDHFRRDVLEWAVSVVISHPLEEANRIIRECARVCLNEAVIRGTRGEALHLPRADAKLTEYLWLLDYDLTDWFRAIPGFARFSVAADLLGPPLPVA